jgi:uncharacterized Ntn-hydrolase superfamily protein
MTYSIVARSADGTHLGVAVASKFLAAGAVVPAARAGVGAVATQSFVNLHYLPDGLALMEQGVRAGDALERLTDADALREERQVAMVDAGGRSAAFTGSGCIDWAGHRSAENVTVQGNCLAGPQVADDMLAAFDGTDGQPLSHRLLDLHQLYFGKPDPSTLLPLVGELAEEVAERVQKLGFTTLTDWAGWANYEERLVPGKIDPVVLEKLREASS